MKKKPSKKRPLPEVSPISLIHDTSLSSRIARVADECGLLVKDLFRFPDIVTKYKLPSMDYPSLPEIIVRAEDKLAAVVRTIRRHKY